MLSMGFTCNWIELPYQFELFLLLTRASCKTDLHGQANKRKWLQLPIYVCNRRMTLTLSGKGITRISLGRYQFFTCDATSSVFKIIFQISYGPRLNCLKRTSIRTSFIAYFETVWWYIVNILFLKYYCESFSSIKLIAD